LESITEQKLNYLILDIKEELLMSRVKADQPKRLAEKLKQIRLGLNLTQDAFFTALEKELKGKTKIHFGYITRYESSTRVPSLLVLLAYARIGKVSLESLIDDKLDLLK
jgi:transcriptional regulator with XRE-family HTH domain